MAEIMTPFELIGGMQTIKNNRLVAQMNQRKIQKADEEQQRTNALRSLYQQSKGDPMQIRSGMIEQGFGDQIPEFDQQQREISKEQRLAEKDQLGAAIQTTTLIAQGVSPFVGKPYSPEIDQQYQQWKASTEQQIGKKLTTMPDSYEPETIARGYQQGMTVAQQLAQQYKAYDIQKDQEQMAFNKQKFGQQSMLDTAKLAEASRAHDMSSANQQWYQAPGPDGMPVWKQGKREGAQVYAPNVISNKPMPTNQSKQVIGVTNLNDSIDEYTKELDNFGITDIANPDKRAAMGTKYNNMMLQAKEAYNLGVLNGPDMDILQSVITDPRTLTGAITSNNALKSQATELKRIMEKVKGVAGSNYSREGGSSPKQPLSIPEGWQDTDEQQYQAYLKSIGQ